jgi:ribosome maturation factor RimP
MTMNTMTRRALGAAAAAVICSATVSFAQQPQTVRIRGQIEKADGDTFDIKTRGGESVKVKLVEPQRVMALVKATLADIKPGSYIGVTAMPQADGSQKAIAIHIFLENMRGTAEGHRPWDREPGSTMTNAAVDTTVAGVDGQTIVVKYKDGEKKVTVPPNIPIVAYAPGNKGELKPGANVFIVAATKQADGSLTAPGMNVGRDGVVPPM